MAPTSPPPAQPAAPGPATPVTNQNAIIALVLAVVSFVVCPLIAAIVALVFAGKAKKEIAASNGWQTGDGLVTGAKVAAWINIAVSLLFILIYGLIIILAIASGSTN
ncbi:MAG: hypothetical protein HQ526_03125 [Actinobacteria bacterium]|nr:hypothetical protein [Actinomycetota bacterium]